MRILRQLIAHPHRNRTRAEHELHDEFGSCGEAEQVVQKTQQTHEDGKADNCQKPPIE